MTLTIEVPELLESDLVAGAEDAGLPLADFALRLMAMSLIPDRPKPSTGAELVDYWRREGLIGTHPEITDSQAYARALRARAEARGTE